MVRINICCCLDGISDGACKQWSNYGITVSAATCAAMRKHPNGEFGLIWFRSNALLLLTTWPQRQLHQAQSQMPVQRRAGPWCWPLNRSRQARYHVVDSRNRSFHWRMANDRRLPLPIAWYWKISHSTYVSRWWFSIDSPLYFVVCQAAGIWRQ